MEKVRRLVTAALVGVLSLSMVVTAAGVNSQPAAAAAYGPSYDFGNGLSSFSYLQSLPVDYIKIDGNFVRNIAANHVHQCMVDAIHRVGKAMGIRMIAEHVESRQTLELLAEIGVEYVQGFHISAPQPVSRFPRLAARGTRPALRLA